MPTHWEESQYPGGPDGPLTPGVPWRPGGPRGPEEPEGPGLPVLDSPGGPARGERVGEAGVKKWVGGVSCSAQNPSDITCKSSVEMVGGNEGLQHCNLNFSMVQLKSLTKKSSLELCGVNPPFPLSHPHTHIPPRSLVCLDSEKLWMEFFPSLFSLP